MSSTQQISRLTAILPRSDGEFEPCPTVMTEEELIRFLRIPEISKRTRGLPRIHLCGKTVYLTDSVKAWLENHLRFRQ